ncbi:unnamed protein product [Ectocarpus sp. CCAP 1310/34]|nr:unnamed protein product [Ectocarpus sp. CCAP 1310/34]
MTEAQVLLGAPCATLQRLLL